ncbi:MAG: DUF4374 domain-containing protein [Mangrovibacterium sp.]
MDELGDAYAFSGSLAQDDSYTPNSTKPAAVTKINIDTDEFDTTYFFDINEATSGKFITSWTYAGNGKFLANMGADKTTDNYGGKYFAIVDVYNKTVTTVTGVPEAASISQLTDRNCYATADGNYVYVGITTDAEGSYVYRIDINAATATRGIKVEGGNITAISKIAYEG